MERSTHRYHLPPWIRVIAAAVAVAILLWLLVIGAYVNAGILLIFCAVILSRAYGGARS